MKKRFFMSNNYHALKKAVDALQTRDPSLHGLGLVFGKWGLGKTEAIEYYYGESHIHYIEVDPLWNPRGLLKGICEELQISPEYRTDDLTKQVWKELKRRRQPLFIDEADRLANKPILLDVVRFLHNKSRVPVILVGMDEICRKLQKIGQFWSRILPAGIVEFMPLTPPEMILITKNWTELDMSPEASELLCSYTEGDFRFIIGYLLEIEKACKTNKMTDISLQMIEAYINKLSKKRDLRDRFAGQEFKKLRTVGRENA